MIKSLQSKLSGREENSRFEEFQKINHNRAGFFLKNSELSANRQEKNKLFLNIQRNSTNKSETSNISNENV